MEQKLLSPADELTSALRWSYLAAVLIGLAFIVAAYNAVVGAGGAHALGLSIGRTLGSLTGLAAIAWLVNRKKSSLSQAKGMVVVGLLLCLLVGNNIIRDHNERGQAKQFLKDAFALQARYTIKFEDLGRRFDNVTVAQYLTPESLASPASVATGKAALERYRLLLQERNLLLQAYLAEYVAFISSLPPGDFRSGAESAIGPNKETTESLYKTLDNVQSKHASSMAAVFNWAEANVGKFSSQNGRLLFTTAAQQAQLQILVNRLQEAENAATAAAQKAQGAGAAEK